MKKTIVFILCLTMLLALCGCGAGRAAERKTEPSFVCEQTQFPVQNRPVPEGEPREPHEPQRMPAAEREILSLQSFSQDRAWVSFSQDGAEYWALVDTIGNALVTFQNDGESYPEPFSNGYSHVRNERTQMGYVLDPMGKICSAYPYTAGDGAMLWAQGGGCVITVKNISGFDTAGYQYTIYGPNGEVLDQVSSESSWYIRYWGKGVFFVDGIGYYCSRTNKWVYQQAYIPTDVEDSPFDRYQVEALVMDTNDEGSTRVFTLLYPDGTVRRETFDWSRYAEKYGPISTSPVVDGVSVLHLYQKALGGGYSCVSVNFNTGETFELEESYAGRMDCFDNDNRCIADLTPADGRVIVPLRGADGAGYMGIFDTQMKLAAEPVPSDSTLLRFSNGKVIVEQSGAVPVLLVCDTRGEVLYDLTELGFRNSRGYDTQALPYSCGLLAATQMEQFRQVYLDASGCPLELNFDHPQAIFF